MGSLSILVVLSLAAAESDHESALTLNRKDTGYRGIWYMNEPLKNEYRFKYSGGLGTFCAKHSPFAVYCDKVKKTFFCYGGTTEDSHLRHDLTTAGDSQDMPGVLLHMVSYYDHTTGKVPRPTILLDKRTKDAHDNPVIAVDDKGYIWIFSTSHGTSRPSYIHRSRQPYNIDEFEQVHATKLEDGREVPMTNFSYMQSWFVSGQGFAAFFTRYNYPAKRTACFMTSPDGTHWSAWQRLAAIAEGHYQISTANQHKAGSALDYHPKGKGLNWRTNLYYVETTDCGRSWQGADGASLALPLTEPRNAAIVHDYEKDGLLVYLKHICFDEANQPVILFITSKGFRSGPEDGPRTWTTARWTGSAWEIRPITTSGNNYDMGSLYIEADGLWRIIGPTERGPQPYNPGGEMAMWTSYDQGATWKKVRQLTSRSPFNHTFARRPVNAHDDFYAFWADGHGRQPSASSLYFCTRAGTVFRLPRTMTQDFEAPEPRPNGLQIRN
ncbi:MAG: hypothetical protein EHM35_05765 [Planctomycetaceae bacterium]|nr:MAG: hypothetical protein EHM35_05765 [Planctomycetaceae bacterium]